MAVAGMACSSAEEGFSCLYSNEVGSVEEITMAMDEEQHGRLRLRQPEKWTKKHTKRPGLRKNSPRVDITAVECCKKQCNRMFTPVHLAKIRKDFESMFYEPQNQYLSGFLHRYETKKSSGHCRKENPAISSSGKRVGRPPAEASQFSFRYTIHNADGINVKICQKAFCAIHGFGPKRILVLRRKLQTSGGCIEPDQRGKHDNHPAVSKSTYDLVKAHIRSVPSRQSHYSRADNSGRTYVSPELSISRLYRDFLQKHDPDYVVMEQENQRRKRVHQPALTLRAPSVSEHYYHDIFVTDFNIHFGYPRSDSCATCDSFRQKIESASGDEEERLQKELDNHQTFAKTGYYTFRSDQKLCVESWNKV